MKRASYRDSVDWLAGNDDNDWLENEDGRIGGQPTLSVPASLVCDIFEVSAERLIADLRRAVARARASYASA